jgi:hypothetical protein
MSLSRLSRLEHIIFGLLVDKTGAVDSTGPFLCLIRKKLFGHVGAATLGLELAGLRRPEPSIGNRRSQGFFFAVARIKLVRRTILPRRSHSESAATEVRNPKQGS